AAVERGTRSVSRPFFAAGGEALDGERRLSLRLRRQVLVEKSADPRLRQRADALTSHLALDEQSERPRALDAKAGRRDRVLVDVQLRQLELAAHVAGDSLEDRSDDAARPAPGGPEVDQHRNLAGSLEHDTIEIVITDIAH